MKTVFGLIQNTEKAEEVVDLLLEKGIQEADINVIVQAEVAKNELEIDRNQATVQVTDELGDKEIRGLKAILAGEQFDELPVLGRVFAAGEFANLIARNASGPDVGAESLAGALEELGVEDEIAKRYSEGIDGGGYLLCVRAEDAQAPAVASAFNDQGAIGVTSQP